MLREVDLYTVVNTALNGVKHVCLALSGGVDSMVLAHVVSKISQVKITCAHVNHNTRPDCLQEQEFVEDWCASNNISCLTHSLSPCPLGVNFESWARKKRYDWFDLIREDAWLLTAHHADDVVETFLMQLLANRETLVIEEINTAKQILRPFWSIKKDVLEKYAFANQVPYVTDSSNHDQRFLRNKYRHTILPFLRNQITQGLDRIVFEQAQSLDADGRYLRNQAELALQCLEGHEFFSRLWLRAISELFNSLPSVVVWRLAEAVLLREIGFRLGRRHSLRFVEFILGTSPRIELPGKVVLERQDGGLVRR
jgi:tRNA(Ile)-lysidine synthetase-like protein